MSVLYNVKIRLLAPTVIVPPKLFQADSFPSQYHHNKTHLNLIFFI